MKTETVDYHGHTVEDALSDLEKRVWGLDTAVNGKCFEIITGFGVIRDTVIGFLNDNGFEWRHKFGNMGCILVDIERAIREDKP